MDEYTQNTMRSNRQSRQTIDIGLDKEKISS